MTREYSDYLKDIVNAMMKAETFIENMTYEEFVQDDKTVYAVIRAIEIIGEAVKQVPDSMREKHSEIPWKSMAGMRDKLIHHYFGVNLKLVWNTVKQEIPEVMPVLQNTLQEYK